MSNTPKDIHSSSHVDAPRAADGIQVRRRAFIGSALKGAAASAVLAGGAAGLTGCGGSEAHAAAALPQQGEFIFRGGHVLSMDPGIGDLATGDVHIKDGVIVKIAPSISSSSAEVIDASDCIVMPGFVDGHWHMMNALWRGLVNDKAGFTYFEVFGRLGPAYTPADSYAGVKLALTEAINAGFTTVHNWSNNNRSPAHADAELSAHVELGVRTRWSYGAPFGLPDIPWSDVTRVRQKWFVPGDRMMTLGIGATQVGLGAQTIQQTAAELSKARALGLPVSLHSLATQPDSPDSVRFLIDNHLLGPDLQLLHGISSEPFLAEIAAAGTSLAMSPTVEPLTTTLVPPVPAAMTQGIKLSIAVDTSALASADMFMNMRVVWASAHLRSGGSNLPSARQLLQIATLGGATAHGLQDITGSLKPGKRADLIMVRKSDINMQLAPDIDPAWLLVSSGRPENVDTVMVDGRVLKKGGVLTTVKVPDVMKAAKEALQGLRTRAAMPALGASAG